MSADSPKCTRPQFRPQGGSFTVSPQQVTDPTILDSVAGFIQEVVPSAYNQQCDSKDQIQWAHFEQLDCDESTFSPNFDCDKVIPPPLVLVLGYTTGIQVWSIPANGEASEILSWRHGSVRVLRVLPNPFKVGIVKTTDSFTDKRPLIALGDTAPPGPQYCTLSFLSLKTSDQVKQIKFKTPILDVLANRHSICITFLEKIAIFDAFTLEDRCTVTTCYLSPGVQPNPIALGTRWLAYAEKKLNPSRRSSGGNDGEGIQSYTATVLHAAKSIGRGLRELSETVASSLTGNHHYKPGTSPGSPQAGGTLDVPQKGIVTILDIESNHIDNLEKTFQTEAIIAHFAAHTEAIVCLQFDPSGMLLLTADKRGHDFHLFRIQSHPAGPSLASIHHLYILHRGDTTAKVQDMCFSPDSRWVTVSSLRGTTHVFPITPYGGNLGVRTHTTQHVVNKMSRFHRSAGLTAEGRSNSPVSLVEMPPHSHFPYHNPRLSPFPHATVVHPLAQIRQPLFLQNISNVSPRNATGRQRLSSTSEDNIALRVASYFAAPRAYIDGLTPPRETPSKPVVKPVESLFIISCHGSLVQYDLDPQPAANIPKEKICDDTPIELSVVAKAQWTLQRQPHSCDVSMPLSPHHLQYVSMDVPLFKKCNSVDNDDHWLSQVEIVTHAGPHRRLWMGPQFTFKTYTTTNGSPMTVMDIHPIEVSQSKPMNMPLTKTNAILIESGSANSSEQSLLDTYQKNCKEVGGIGELQLKEDLADAMLESPGMRDTGSRCVIVSMKSAANPPVTKVVNPVGTVVTVLSDDEDPPTVSEDEVIHENCDEALFRPVVAPNPSYENFRANDSSNIMTKSLSTKTELRVIPKEDAYVSKNKNAKKPTKVELSESKPLEICLNPKVESTETKTKKPEEIEAPVTKKRNKKNKTEASKVIQEPKLQPRSQEVTKPKPIPENITDSVFTVNEIDFAELPSLSLPTFEESESIKDCTISENLNHFNLDFFESPPLKVDDESDFASLDSNKQDIETVKEPIINLDLFEDADDCYKQDKQYTTKSDYPDLMSEDKNTTLPAKKPRKPKTKLGVRISNKETTKLAEIEPEPMIKKSWNVIAAPKTTNNVWGDPRSIKNMWKEPAAIEIPWEEPATIDIPWEEPATIDIPWEEPAAIESPWEEPATIESPWEQPATIESPWEVPEPFIEPKIIPEIVDLPEEEFKIDKPEDDVLLKVYKTSDDEKVDSTSTVETTESDDSSKVPAEVGIAETEAIKSVSQSKSSKRKSKKKRK